ncbi:MAG: hypothetical protein GF313_05780, partial [Caldithrix sp.]|nr:hypothetical protein [Caldithrix sp.]
MTKKERDVIDWLLEGDLAIRWQVIRDLLDSDQQTVQHERKQAALKGWGRRLLDFQQSNGIWGEGLYTPKWTSTTYTLLLLRRLGLPPGHNQALRGCQKLLDKGFYKDGGINFFASLKHSETCVTGMVLSILAYFGYRDERMQNLAGHLLGQQMADGGWNCQSYNGATHGSFHTTICVLEGLREYEIRIPQKKNTDIGDSQQRGREFLLLHRLFRSHRTGKVVDVRMTRLS